jgi:prepilin peptidase CpaA
LEKSVVDSLASPVLTALLLAAAWSDIRIRRIPNLLTVSGLVAALGLRLAVGPAAAIEGLIGVLLAFVVVLPFFVLSVMGGGDTKLLMMIGAFMGPRHFLWAAVLIAIIGGMMAVIDAGRRGALMPVLFNCGEIMKHWATFGRRGANRSIATVGAMTIPYGVAIAAGTLLWWFAGAGGL